MAVRPVDAEKYMELLKEQYLHHEAMGNKQVAKAWQGAMQLLYDMPTIIQQNGPLTQADLDAMDYDKVWLDYGDDGEWALVVRGRIYSLAVLEGSGFEDILRDEVEGETMDRPSGDYTVYRRPPEGEESDGAC